MYKVPIAKSKPMLLKIPFLFMYISYKINKNA
jgi:hypothetical protein